MKKKIIEYEIKRRWIPLLLLCSFVCVSFLGLLVHPVAAAASYYVSTTGSDSNAGTQASPFKTIHRAINASTTGSNIYIEGGTYTPYTSVTFTKSGAVDDWFIIQPYMGETVIINGTNSLSVDNSIHAIFTMVNCHYVRITDLVFEWSQNGGVSMNYAAQGSLCSHVRIDNCTIRNNGGWAVKAGGGSDFDIADNLIVGNFNNWHSETLSQETISFSDVDDSYIQGNVLYRNRAENIDLKSGCSDIFVSNNTINTGNTTGSCSKGGQTFFGGVGIYVDGQSSTCDNITINGNIVTGNHSGIQIVSENSAGKLYDIEIFNNVLSWSGKDGGAADQHRGYPMDLGANTETSHMYRVNVYMNTVVGAANWSYGCLSARQKKEYYHYFYVYNNIFIDRNVTTNFHYMLTLDRWNTTDNLVNKFELGYNWYYRLGSYVEGISWASGARTLGFGLSNTTNTDPELVAVSSGDYELNSTSGCIDDGYGTLYRASHDILGIVRPQGDGYDIGAYEYAYNADPVISGIPDQTVDEGSGFSTINLDGYVSDPDDDDDDLVWSFTGDVELVFSVSSRVLSVVIPSVDWYGAETIVLTVRDPEGLTDTDTVVFTVTSVNDAPVCLNIPDQSVVLGDSFIPFSLDDYVSDVDGSDASMTWTTSGESPLFVDITDRVVTVSNPSGVTCNVVITFRATDASSAYDEDSSTFMVSALTEPEEPDEGSPDASHQAESDFIELFLPAGLFIGIIAMIFLYIHGKGWF